MDIISFFRNIDGVLYYIMLVINTILIFAIIGYLGEKNNQKLIKMGLEVPRPNNNGGLDFSSTTVKHGDANIPTVTATTVAEPQVLNNDLNNVNQPVLNPSVQQTQNNQTVPTQMVQQMPNNQPVINNEIDPNEKAPAVLVINSDNTNMPK